MAFITNLPDELVIYILEYLDNGEEILDMCQVKRQYYGPSTDDRVWKRHCEEFYDEIGLSDIERAGKDYIDDYKKQLKIDNLVKDLIKKTNVSTYHEQVVKIGKLGARARVELNKNNTEYPELVNDCLKAISHLRAIGKLCEATDPFDVLKTLDWGFYWDSGYDNQSVETVCKNVAKEFIKEQHDENNITSNIREFSKFLTKKGILPSAETNSVQHIGELEIKNSGLGARNFLSGIFSPDVACCNEIICAYIYTMIFKQLCPDITTSVVIGITRGKVFVKLNELLVDIASEGAIKSAQNDMMEVRPLTKHDLINKVITPGIDMIGDSIFTQHCAVAGRSFGLRIAKQLLQYGDLKDLKIPDEFATPWDLELINWWYPKSA